VSVLILSAVEDEIVRRLRAAFGGRVRAVDHKPARLDEEELARVLTLAPGVFVAFLDWARDERLRETVSARWGVYLLAANAAGEPARRRGDQVEIGGYEMCVLASAALDHWIAPSSAGAAEVQGCESLFSPAFDRAGRSCFALTLSVPVPLPQWDVAAAEPGLFITFDAAWDIPPHGDVAFSPANNRDARDRVVLPQ